MLCRLAGFSPNRSACTIAIDVLIFACRRHAPAAMQINEPSIHQPLCALCGLYRRKVQYFTVRVFHLPRSLGRHALPVTGAATLDGTGGCGDCFAIWRATFPTS